MREKVRDIIKTNIQCSGSEKREQPERELVKEKEYERTGGERKRKARVWYSTVEENVDLSYTNANVLVYCIVYCTLFLQYIQYTATVRIQNCTSFALRI
jgi:hypothetical protein